MKIKDVKLVRDVPESAVLVNVDYEVYSILAVCGIVPSEEDNPNWLESDAWLNAPNCLFVLLDESGADYLAVWALSYGSVPYLNRPVDLIWYNNCIMDDPVFERFDIAEAYACLEHDYNVSGVLQKRKSNIRRKMSTGYQLKRMAAFLRPNLAYHTLTPNGKQIYNRFVIDYLDTTEYKPNTPQETQEKPLMKWW